MIVVWFTLDPDGFTRIPVETRNAKTILGALRIAKRMMRARGYSDKTSPARKLSATYSHSFLNGEGFYFDY